MALRSAAHRLRQVCQRRLMSSGQDRLPYNRWPAYKLTQPPNPKWDLGQGIPKNGFMAQEWKQDLEHGWKTWKLDDLPNRDAYRLITSAIVPRPIAFVASESADGVPNLAPMSYFNAVSSNPPLLSISLTLSARRPKDTRENILATKQFTVNIISETFVEAANACSVEAPAHINEWIVSGLTPERSETISVPRVQESAVAFECELYKHIDITPLDSDEVTNTHILGLIKQVHVRKAVLNDDGGSIDPVKLRPVARLSGGTYVRLGEAFDLERPSWKAWKDRVEEMHKRRQHSMFVSS